MSGKKLLRSLTAKRFLRARHHLSFRASNIGDQGFRRQSRGESFDQFDDRAYRSCEHDHIAALAGFNGVRDSCMNGCRTFCTRQNFGPIAADDPAGKTIFSERQSKRASDEASADDRDLAN